MPYPPNGPTIPLVELTGGGSPPPTAAPAPGARDRASQWNMELLGHTGNDGVVSIVDRKKLLTEFKNPLTPTEAELLAPQVGYLHMSPDQGAHTTFPIFGVPIPGFQGHQALRKRDLLLRPLEAAGLRLAGGDATFFLWLAVPAGESSEGFATRLLRRGIVVAPGSYLGPAGEGYVRLALVPTEEECRRAAAVLQEGV